MWTILFKLTLFFHVIYIVNGGCRPLRAPFFGTLQGQCEGEDGDVCTLVCSDNYEIHGSVNKTCNASIEKWEPVGPFSCQNHTLQCKSLRPPTNGNFRRQCSNFAGSSCYIGCNPGYFLYGSKRLVCMPKTLTWAPETPQCKALLCPSLPVPKNGHLVSKECKRYIGAHCEFSCDPGYYTYGHRLRRCSKGGVWTGITTKCVRTCPDIKPRANMKMWNYCSPGVSGKTCSLTCDEGYVINGTTSHLICGNNGHWESSLPHCIQSSCPNLSPPLNGTSYGNCQPGVFGMPCIFSCNYGFKLVGEESSVCMFKGEWSSKPPVCKEITCNGISWDNVEKSQGTCKPGYPDKWCNIECIPGFEVPKHANVTCLVSGRWFPEEPFCNKRNKCDPLEAPENGFLDPSCTFDVGSVCQQNCYPEFVGQGTGYRICTSLGYWDGDLKRCLLKKNFKLTNNNYD